MHTHLHLISSNMHDTTLSDIMRDFRQFTSRKIKDQLLADKRIHFLKIFEKARYNSPKQKYLIWKEGFHPIALTSEKWIIEKMEYMNWNPVRKGFVELPAYWKYSSSRNWILRDERIIEINRVY